MSDTYVRPNVAQAQTNPFNNAANAIDGSGTTFANNATSGFLSTEQYVLNTHAEQAAVIGVELHWLCSGDMGSIKVWIGPASNPAQDLILTRTANFTERTEVFLDTPSRRVAVADNPTVRFQVFGILSTTTFQLFDIRFLLADRCRFTNAEGAA
jgi:hypothetical protein